eukprot:1391630-Prymnesium_polylepis.1
MIVSGEILSVGTVLGPALEACARAPGGVCAGVSRNASRHTNPELGWSAFGGSGTVKVAATVGGESFMLIDCKRPMPPLPPVPPPPVPPVVAFTIAKSRCSLGGKILTSRASTLDEEYHDGDDPDRD